MADQSLPSPLASPTATPSHGDGPTLLSVGIVVQVHTVDRKTLQLSDTPAELAREIENGPYAGLIRPQTGSPLIEIRSQRHLRLAALREEMHAIRCYLSSLGGALGHMVCGGGCHPLPVAGAAADWPELAGQPARIEPAFGMHLHIGCPDPALASYLCRSWTRYLPHLIALSAASPFHAGVDTECASYRSSRRQGPVGNGLTSEGAPSSDIHLDRAGQTVVIRVCDAPLNLDTAVDLAAYAQALTAYLLAEVPAPPDDEAAFDYLLARSQAARFGFDGLIGAHDDGRTIAEDILATLEELRLSGRAVDVAEELNHLEQQVLSAENDAQALRAYQRKHRDLSSVVARQALIWAAGRADGVAL